MTDSAVVRTPDSRFDGLVDYPFEPRYTDVVQQAVTLRMHYVDEGPANAAPVLMLHGEPSWSYLYRHMISPVVIAGHRVVVPDLIGFGKSDKLTRIGDYSYARHLDWLTQFLDRLELKDICLVCQDWGSLLGLRLVTAQPDRFRAVVIGNGFLPTGEQPIPMAFRLWKTFALYSPWFPIDRILDMGTRRSLTLEEKKAYAAPFHNRQSKAGARAFPRLVPIDATDREATKNREAWAVLGSWDKPFLTTFSSGDPIMRGGERYFKDRVPGARGLPHVILRGGHFLQEDSPQEFAAAIVSLLNQESASE